jgi:ribosomal protein L10
MKPKTLKWIHQYKLQKFLTTYPYIFLCQYHGLSVSKWHDLRIQVKHIPNTGFLVLKNTLVVDTFCQNLKIQPLECKSVFQGPSIAIGFSQHKDIHSLLSYFQSIPDVVILAGVFENHVFSFQDLLKYQSLDQTVYTVFLQTLEAPQIRFQEVQSLDFMNLIPHPARCIITWLEHGVKKNT